MRAQSVPVNRPRINSSEFSASNKREAAQRPKAQGGEEGQLGAALDE